MFFVIQFFLLKLPPETAHGFAIFLLKIYQFFQSKILRKIPQGKISIQVPPQFQWNVGSRLGLAAGFDKQAEVFPALCQLGFGFVEIGTVTPLPQSGNPKPRIWRVAPEALVNHLGFNSIGLELFRKNLLKHRSDVKVPLLANIGKNSFTSPQNAMADYQTCLEGLRGLVDGFVINLSSPNTPGLRDLQTVQFLKGLCEILPSAVPTLIKLAPDLSPQAFQEVCEMISQEKKLAGIVIVNTSRELSEKRGFSKGGLSGPPLFAMSLDFVERARVVLKKNKIIIGVGGVSSKEEAQEMRDAGADLIEIYTAFVYKGPRLVQEINETLH